jgi:hypothetical protein
MYIYKYIKPTSYMIKVPSSKTLHEPSTFSVDGTVVCRYFEDKYV